MVQVILGAGSPCAWQGMISSLPISCRYSALGDTLNDGGSCEEKRMLMTNLESVQIWGPIYEMFYTEISACMYQKKLIKYASRMVIIYRATDTSPILSPLLITFFWSNSFLLLINIKWFLSDMLFAYL